MIALEIQPESGVSQAKAIGSGPHWLDRTGVELSENPAAHANDTNTRSGGPSVIFDLSPVAFLASWNTSAGVR